MFSLCVLEDDIRVVPQDLTKQADDAVASFIESRFVDKVLIGKIKSSTRAGLRITLGFFDDVIVPEHALQDPSFFDDSEKLWIWKFDGNDMYMDVGETVRVRVHSLRYNTPPTPIQLQNAQGDDKLIGTALRPFSPLEVVGDINGDGLGLLSWWDSTRRRGSTIAHTHDPPPMLPPPLASGGGRGFQWGWPRTAPVFGSTRGGGSTKAALSMHL
eukprot:gene28470-31619_t